MRKGAAWVLLAALWLVLPVSPARAQSANATDVPDRFQFEAGGFNMFVSTNMVFNSLTLGGTTVNFEKDLNLPDTAQRGFVEGYWRLARRHQLSISYSRLNRTGSGVSLSHDINWGGNVFPAGATAMGTLDSSFFSGTYRFAVYRNSSFEVGPAVGFGYLKLTAGINATFSVGGPQGKNVSTTLNPETNETTPTGDIGGYANWWLAKRWYARGDLRYIIVKPENTTASITEGRGSVTWYPWTHFGIGGQYEYTKFRFDRTLLSASLGGNYRYDGVQLLGVVAF